MYNFIEMYIIRYARAKRLLKYETIWILEVIFLLYIILSAIISNVINLITGSWLIAIGVIVVIFYQIRHNYFRRFRLTLRTRSSSGWKKGEKKVKVMCWAIYW